MYKRQDISSGNYYEWKKICWIAFIILLQVIFSVGVLYLMSWMAHKIIMQLRDDLWSKVLHLPIEYFDRTETGEIMSRITNDTMVISEFITNDFLSAITAVSYTHLTEIGIVSKPVNRCGIIDI